MSQFQRTELLLSSNGVKKLNESTVAIFGIGGVGGYCTEALARAGIGSFILVDKDIVDETNLNRQIIALHSTIGKQKVEIMKERIKDINQNASVDIFYEFYTPENSEKFFYKKIDYIIDAVDNVTAKIDLAVKAQTKNIPIISSMGTGNKLDPTRFEIADIYDTSVCKLAKVMRKELKDRNVEKLKVVYSKEEPIKIESEEKTIGSVSFVPSVAGLIMAGEVVKDILKV